MEKKTSQRYQPPLSHLFTLGEPVFAAEWPNYLTMGFTPEHISTLIQIATDENLNYASSDSNEVWAPLHAWRTLGQLKALNAIDALVSLVDKVDDWDDDWSSMELPQVFTMLGPAAVQPLIEYLANADHGVWARSTAATAMVRINKQYPDMRQVCVEAITSTLEKFERNEALLNGELISCLIDLNAVESAPVMERAFAAEKVDYMNAGDWEEVQLELGLIEERTTPRPRFGFLQELFASEMEEKRVAAQRSKKTIRKEKAKRKLAQKSRKKNRKKRK